jgi:hypothetical protein
MNNSGFTANRNPNTTDYEEHGAAGDVSTGRRLKYTQSVPMAVRTDPASDTVLYVGQAKPGTLTSQALWRISKVDTSSGTVITFADGDDLYNNVWDDRATLTYI